MIELLLKKLCITAVDIPLDKDSGSFGKWTVKYHGLYGLCYALDLGSEITSRVVRSVTFSSKLYFYIFLHHEGQYLNINSMMKVCTIHFMVIKFLDSLELSFRLKECQEPWYKSPLSMMYLLIL